MCNVVHSKQSIESLMSGLQSIQRSGMIKFNDILKYQTVRFKYSETSIIIMDKLVQELLWRCPLLGGFIIMLFNQPLTWSKIV